MLESCLFSNPLKSLVIFWINSWMDWRENRSLSAFSILSNNTMLQIREKAIFDPRSINHRMANLVNGEIILNSIKNNRKSERCDYCASKTMRSNMIHYFLPALDTMDWNLRKCSQYQILRDPYWQVEKHHCRVKSRLVICSLQNIFTVIIFRLIKFNLFPNYKRNYCIFNYCPIVIES